MSVKDATNKSHSIDTETSTGDENKERGNWTGRLDFILSCIGFAVGLGNVWRFPYKCYKYGGGAFLIPYVISLALAGLPLFFMELAFGQFASLGPLPIWNIAPLWKGIGWGMVMISYMVSIYYNVIIAWVIYYFFVSLRLELPWETCDHEWNTPLCRNLWNKKYTDPTMNNTYIPTVVYMCNQTLTCSIKQLKDYCYNVTQAYAIQYEFQFESHENFVCSSFPNATDYSAMVVNLSDIQAPSYVSASEEYWEYEVIGRSPGLGTPGKFQWKLVLCLLAAWLVIFGCLFKGVKSSGKVVYFTATFPYLVLVALMIRGVTLPGAESGIIWYLKPDFEKLLNGEVWVAAATQIFYSLGPAFGGLITMASYNRFHNNCYRDAIIVSIVNCGTSVFAGFAIFSLIGFMAHAQGIADPSKVAADGPGLAFIAYPEGIAQMPFGRPVWSALFFFMLFTLGLDSQFAMMETVISALSDEYLWLRKKKFAFTGVICLISFILGLPLVTEGGVYAFTLMDNYTGGYNLLIVAFCEVMVIAWIYGYNNFADDIEMMLAFRPNIYWRVTWQIISPLLILIILIFSAITWAPSSYGAYTFPGWGDAIGFILAIISISFIPGHMMYLLFWPTCKKYLEPAETWGPALDKFRTGRYLYKSRQNTLDDADRDDETKTDDSVINNNDDDKPIFIVNNNIQHQQYDNIAYDTKM